MDLDFLCLTPGDYYMALLCRNGGCASDFYLAQRYLGRVWYCSRSFRP